MDHALRTHFDLELLLRQRERVEISQQIAHAESVRLKLSALHSSTVAKMASVSSSAAAVSSKAPPPPLLNVAGSNPANQLFNSTSGEAVSSSHPSASMSVSTPVPTSPQQQQQQQQPVTESGSSAQTNEPSKTDNEEKQLKEQHNLVEDHAEDNNAIALFALRDDGVRVKVVCPVCKRSDFASVHGFISHCRNAHRKKFPSLMVAVRLCGKVVDEDQSAQNPAGERIMSTVPQSFDRPAPQALRESDLTTSNDTGTSLRSKKVMRVNVYETNENIDILTADTSLNQSRTIQKFRALDTLDSLMEEPELKPDESLDEIDDNPVDSMDLDTETTETQEVTPLISIHELNRIAGSSSTIGPSSSSGSTFSGAPQPPTDPQPQPTSTNLEDQNSTRFLIKQRIVIGNVSRYIPEEKRKLPKYEFKWMVYVQGPPTNPDITPFIERVRFHLHPDYRPNDVIDVTSPPFQVTRYGWGEFPIRIRLFFVDPRNKTVDLMYSIKLDRYMTGRQTPGGEVWTDLMLDKNTEFRQSAESSGLIRRPTDASRPSWATDEKERVSTGWGRSYKPKGSLRGLGTNGWQIRRKERAANGKFGGVKEQGTSSSVGAVKKEEGADIGMDYKMEIEATEKGVEILQEEVVSVLEPLMSQFPLIKSGEESLDSSQVTYPTAESLESFESMSEAERITFEENRASAILSHATSALDLPPSHGIHSLSIETLTKWCRLAGYTPVYEGDDEPVETRVLSNATEGGNSGTTDMQLDLPAVEQQLQEPIKPIVPHVKKKEPLPFCKFCGRRHKKPQSEDAKTGSEGVKEEGEETQGLDDPLALYCITQIQPSLSLSGGMSSLSTAEPLLESLKSLKQVSKSNSGSSDTLSNIWDGAAPIRASQNDLAFIWSSVAQIGVAIPDDDEDDQDDEMGEEERHLRRNQRSTSPQKVVADGNESAEIMDEEVRRTPRNVVGGLLYEVMRVFCKRLLKESEAVYREQSDFVVEGISDANSPSIASNANDTNIGNQGLVERRPAASSSTCSNTPIEEGRNRRGLLVPMHVRAAAVRNPQFDFLTNRYLGTFENE